MKWPEKAMSVSRRYNVGILSVFFAVEGADSRFVTGPGAGGRELVRIAR